MGFWNTTPATREEALAENRITDPTTLAQQEAAGNGLPIPPDINTSAPISSNINQQAVPSILNDSQLAQ